MSLQCSSLWSCGSDHIVRLVSVLVANVLTAPGGLYRHPVVRIAVRLPAVVWLAAPWLGDTQQVASRTFSNFREPLCWDQHLEWRIPPR